jgi:hypothetical protein
MAPIDENERAHECARATLSLPGILSTAMHRVEDQSSITRKETEGNDGMHAPLSPQSDSSSLSQSTENGGRNILSLPFRGRPRRPDKYVVRIERTRATVQKKVEKKLCKFVHVLARNLI